MARSWGDGGPTETLHHLAFDMYEDLAKRLKCKTYRKLPVLSVSPSSAKGKPVGDAVQHAMPSWLDGNYGRVSLLGKGDDTAQITPIEFTQKLVQEAEKDGKLTVIAGTCVGVETTTAKNGDQKVNGVLYSPKSSKEDGRTSVIPCDTVIVSAGPWSCAAEDWFNNAVSLPMEGVKSTSIVWKAPQEGNVDATALFCGEDNRFGTHLEVYPRPDNTVYLCGIGGSKYISAQDLKNGEFRNDCDADPNRVQAASDSFCEMSKSYKDNGELSHVQACMRPCPPDALPYMGSIPGFEGAYINAGHNCWGIAWAPACGKAISELVLHGKSTSVDLSPFDPARFTPADTLRGGRGRKRRGTSVGEQW